jgi:hypothetical protein
VKAYLLSALVALGCVGGSGCSDGAGSGTKSIRNHYLPYVAEGVGLYLVDASDFTATSLIVPGDIANVRLFASVPSSENQSRLAVPYAIAVLVESQWYRVWLGKDKPQQSVAIGAPLTASICSSHAVYPDLARPESAVLRYVDAGSNSVCFDADDQVSAIALADGGTATLLNAPGRLVEQIHSATGVLEALVLVQGNSLVLQQYPTAAASVLVESLSRATTA